MQTYKGYQIKADKKHPGCLCVVTEGQGGKIPNILSGMYTTYSLAFRDIDTYLETKIQRGRNAKTETEE
jgi:hypothetical protein